MYFVALIVFLVIVVVIWMFSFAGSLAYLVDFPSLLCILLLSLPMLAVTGLMRDFFRSFSIAFSKECTADRREILRSLTAVKMASRLFLFSGGLSSLIGLIAMLHFLDDPATIGPHLAVVILSLLHACFLYILLQPLRTRLELLRDSCE